MACRQILDLAYNDGFEYETDGLMLPCNYGVGLTKQIHS